MPSGVDQFVVAMDTDVLTGKPMNKFSASVAAKAVAVVPNDATTFAATKGLYVGVAGDVVVVMADGSSLTLKALSAGVIHGLSVTGVKATGTLATDIVALY